MLVCVEGIYQTFIYKEGTYFFNLSLIVVIDIFLYI